MHSDLVTAAHDFASRDVDLDPRVVFFASSTTSVTSELSMTQELHVEV